MTRPERREGRTDTSLSQGKRRSSRCTAHETRRLPAEARLRHRCETGIITRSGRNATAIDANLKKPPPMNPIPSPPALAPEIEQRVRRSFANQGLMRHLGVALTEIARGRVVLRLPFSDNVTQQLGYFHAGGTSAIADSAGGYAGLTVFPADKEVLTVEFKINLIAPGKGDYLEAIGNVVRSGRTLTVCQVEVHGVTASTRTQIALCQQTLIAVQA